MKKLFALLLAVVMVVGMTTVAFAEGETQTYSDTSTVILEKWYNNTNNGVSPAETFTYTWEAVGVTEAGVLDVATQTVVTKETMPKLESVASVSFDKGDAGKVIISNGGNYLCKRDVVITLPEYQAVGIYEYKINEVASNTAGVTYNTDDIKLIVTVIEQEGKVRVAAVHAENTANNPAEGKKDNKLINSYESGTLAVSKEVTGNAGDLEKEFDVKVLFYAPEGKVVKSEITWVDNNSDGIVNGSIEEVDGWKGEKVAYIKLKHGETVTFENIPEGVTYEVVEGDYTIDLGGEYDAPVYTWSDKTEKKIAAGDTDTVKITNNKDVTIDTGILMDSAPYVVMLLVAAAALVLFTTKRRVQD